jgi:radical SAM protein with 4Fe4S-binding SPASM domain
MSVTRKFKLNQPIGLPADVSLLFPVEPPAVTNADNDGTGCAKCGGGRGAAGDHVVKMVMDRFLAVSPNAASYVVLGRELEEPFRLLLQGNTLGDVLSSQEQKHGRHSARQTVEMLLKHLVARNFFEGAATDEYAPNSATLQIYVTNRCNLRCRHCYMSSGEALPNEIGTDARLRAITAFAKLCPGGLVTFTGGEALLDPDIFELLTVSKKLGLRVELYSNGLTIKSSELAERILNTVDYVQISLDGASEEVNDRIRGKGTFRGIIRAIKLIDSAALGIPNFRLRIGVTLTPTNAEDIRLNLLPLVESLQLTKRPQIRVGVVGKLGRAASDEEMYSNDADLRLTQAAIVNDLAQQKIYRFPIDSVNRFSKSCGMGLTIAVGADGSLYPCTITEQSAIGNVLDDDFERKMSSVIGFSRSTNVDNVEGCRDCSIRYFCGGMCRIRNLSKTGSMNKSACTKEYKALMVRDLIGKYNSFGIDA